MKLFELSPPAGSTATPKRKGRGQGTGNGKTAGRGHKGQKARAGGGVRPGFEGGQMPLYLRLPKRGFNNKVFERRLAYVNVSALDGAFDNGAEVAFEQMKEAGLLKKRLDGVVVLGDGELNKALTVRAARFSKSAARKIEAAGGKAEVV